MIDLPWPQISGAVAGGVVGGFSGFVANYLQQRQALYLTKRNVACALIGEVGALAQLIETEYLSKMLEAAQALTEKRTFPYYHFRGERDYMPVFRGLGVNIGVLPTPLPRDLVSWYTHLAVCLERARELHELALGRNPDHVGYMAEIAERQHAQFAELVSRAVPLLERLAGV
jgi:hypothetical protein